MTRPLPHHQNPRRSAAEQARVDDAIRDMFEQRMCFHKLLGFEVSSLAPDGPALSFAMRDELIGHYQHGRLHGGVISAALDSVAGLAVTVGIAEKFHDESAEQIVHRFNRVGTIDLRTDYLHQGIGKIFTATGRITRLGGRIASVQMTLENETGLLIATGGASYVIS
jgi:uncharacterized protein (TIGR00369 family)